MKAIIEICRQGVHFDVEVTGTYHKATLGHRDRYGAPEEPDEPAFFDDVQAVTTEEVLWDDDQGNTLRMFIDGEGVELTAEEEKEASEAMLSAIASAEAEARAKEPEGDDYGEL